MNVYKNCPTFENDKFLLRLTSESDADDLLKVYGDEKSVKLFNSDNCHGDDFHYTTIERMRQAVDFWKSAYENGWFVRFSVVNKATGEAVGTIEEFHRDAQDYFTDCGLLRLDLRSDFETADDIISILSLIVTSSFELFGCNKIATKAIPAAKERIAALSATGFVKTNEFLIGFDETKYGDYFVLEKQ